MPRRLSDNLDLRAGGIKRLLLLGLSKRLPNPLRDGQMMSPGNFPYLRHFIVLKQDLEPCTHEHTLFDYSA